KDIEDSEAEIKYKVEWKTLGEYLAWLGAKGMSVNVASFVGAGTVREAVVGKSPRAPTPAELDQMRALVRGAMEDRALGVTTALIYVPSSYASTDELIALAEVAARYGGMFVAHMRSEGDRLADGIDEMIRIARTAKVRTEIYHLKAAGKQNWGKLDAAIARIEAARKDGVPIT